MLKMMAESFLLRFASLRVVTVCSFIFLIKAQSQNTANFLFSPIVTVAEGNLQGSINTLPNGGTYLSYKGIPYAQPPLGELRFQAPLPPKPWIGVRDATRHGPICVQDLISDTIESCSEDCLFLNVYTKSLQPPFKYPVMVYIHGGGFSGGSGNSDIYGPDYLLRHDCLVVTINYRLEVLGFLCLDMPEAPGNAGLKDHVAALRWLKNNIAQFGGDPENVTIFGISAGSAAVTYHVLSAMSHGLFHKAIAQSGVDLTYWTEGRNYVERAFRIGQALGKNCTTKDELLQFLRNVPAIDLVGMNYRTRTQDEYYVDIIAFFNPVVEKQFNGIESFINEKPLSILTSGKANKVPLMIGYTSKEGLLMMYPITIFSKNNDVKYLVPREITEVISAEKTQEFGDRIKTFYVGTDTFNTFNSDAFVNLVTDTNFFFDTYRFATYYAKMQPLVYTYRFDYDTELNFYKFITGHALSKGACHADDMFYIFQNLANIVFYTTNPRLKGLIDNMTQLWTDFAKTGNPTPNNTGVSWKTFTSCQQYMNLKDPMFMGPNVDNDRLQFWNQLYCEAGVSCL